MPSPREQALSIGTESGKFPTDPVDPNQAEPKGQDYRVNPTNPPEPSAPVKNLKEG